MRVDGTLKFVLSDHLGSTSVMTDASGVEQGRMGYYPFGKTRYTSGSLSTDRLYTGQQLVAGIGLYNYKARYNDAALGRFVSADTVTPGGAQGLNRYSMVMNNPINRTDPTGHKACDEIDANGNCITYPSQDSGKSSIPPDPVCSEGTGDGIKGNPSNNPYVSDDDISAMAVFMYYEYMGYYPSSNIPWDIVMAKFWVFYNLIYSRRNVMGMPIYNSSYVQIGVWNPYTAIAGHESPVKATLAFTLLGGFSETNYDKQFTQILGEAARLSSDPTFEIMYGFASIARNEWNQYGSGSSADPSHGSLSFTDHLSTDPIGGPQWTCTTHPFIFESGSVPFPIWEYSILTIFSQ